MAFEVVVERRISAFEGVHFIFLFEAANNYRHSVPHGSSQQFGGLVRFRRGCKLRKALQFALRPLDLHARQGNIGSYALQPREHQHSAFSTLALADNSMSLLAFRDSPAKQRQRVRQKVGVAAELQLFLEQADGAIFRRCEIRLKLRFPRTFVGRRLNSLALGLQRHLCTSERALDYTPIVLQIALIIEFKRSHELTLQSPALRRSRIGPSDLRLQVFSICWLGPVLPIRNAGQNNRRTIGKFSDQREVPAHRLNRLPERGQQKITALFQTRNAILSNSEGLGYTNLR